MDNYVVGIDGGGTKTIIEMHYLDRQASLRATLGPMNLNSSEKAVVTKTLKDCFEFLNGHDPGLLGCSAICVGSAGATNPDVTHFVQESFHSFGYHGLLTVTSDFESALKGALDGRDGIILISGTGSVCYGCKDGVSLRCGGRGHIVDDEGSAYAIGRDILASVMRAYDGRIAPTVLSDLVYTYLGISDIPQIIRYIYASDTTKKEIAEFAQLLPIAVEANDTAAMAIVKKSSQELFTLVRPIAQNLNFANTQLSLLGSVLINNLDIRNSTIKLIKTSYPLIEIIKPIYDAATGAVIIAKGMLKGAE